MINTINKKYSLVFLSLLLIAVFILVPLVLTNHDSSNHSTDTFAQNIVPDAKLKLEHHQPIFADSPAEDEQSTDATNANEQKLCIHCSETLAQYVFTDAPLTDEGLINLLTSTVDFYAFLNNQPELVDQLIMLASTTDDGNKRDYIIDLLSDINPDYIKTIGIELSVSLDHIKRQQGFNLLSNLLVNDMSITNDFTENLMIEDDVHIKKSIINSLSREDLFYNNEDVINSLRETALIDPSVEIRGKALFAAAKLMVEPEVIFQETIEAIHSNEEKLSFYGLETLDHMLVKMTREERSTEAYEQAIRELVDTFMGEQYNDLDSSLRLKLDSIYQRFL